MIQSLNNNKFKRSSRIQKKNKNPKSKNYLEEVAKTIF